MNPLTQITKQALAEFDSLCYLSTDGRCKYWRPEAFGYDVGDMEALLDRFVPEEVKKYITQSNLALVEALEFWISERISANGCGCESCEARTEQLNNLQSLLTTYKQEINHGYCNVCGIETQPVMKCQCDFRKKPQYLKDQATIMNLKVYRKCGKNLNLENFFLSILEKVRDETIKEGVHNHSTQQ